jgi:hypothetical protein
MIATGVTLVRGIALPYSFHGTNFILLTHSGNLCIMAHKEMY